MIYYSIVYFIGGSRTPRPRESVPVSDRSQELIIIVITMCIHMYVCIYIYIYTCI